MAFRGIDIRESGDRLLFRTLLQDSAGAIVTSGTTNLKLYELQSDGTFKSYDWNDNTFKTTALTTENQAMTHRAGNNGGTNTGVWTLALTTLTGFTAGSIYFAHVSNSGASPVVQVREFQFASGILADVKLWLGSTPAALADTNKVSASVQHDALSLATAAGLAALNNLSQAQAQAAAANAIAAASLATAGGQTSILAAIAGLADFDPDADEVDGVTYAAAVNALMAVLFGEVVVSGNQAEFKARDGSATVVTITYGATDGERTASVIA